MSQRARLSDHAAAAQPGVNIKFTLGIGDFERLLDVIAQRNCGEILLEIPLVDNKNAGAFG